jgi:Raf kinase inhibitor-like YbhB/YbcL family protein
MNLIILYIMSLTISTTLLVIKSSAFKNNEFIPSKYTCDGLNINPEISIDEIPENTKSLAVIVDDPDSPNGTFCHWLIWDISPKSSIKEDSSPGIQGRNSMGENKYSGPCPPGGKHHYHFKVYALDTKLSALPSSTNQKEFEKAMKGHVIAWGELIGLYKR